MKLQSKWLVAALAIVAFVAVRSVSAAPQTWTGKISDAMCGASHGGNGGTDAKDHDCAVKCVKGGSEYVFVNGADKKVFKIANQKFADLEKHAGHTVQLTGELKDGAITVTKVVMPPAK
ncbi:MAG TPA: hypothetical protein VLT86_16895 [Vicinamibacterales bacterium]|nr:hypothetical protein [Vicinamibacterales bacterium]